MAGGCALCHSSTNHDGRALHPAAVAREHASRSAQDVGGRLPPDRLRKPAQRIRDQAIVRSQKDHKLATCPPQPLVHGIENTIIRGSIHGLKVDEDHTPAAGAVFGLFKANETEFTEEKALAFLNGIRAKHRTANHNVYAYILRDGARMRYSDDGEPAKTSGLPTLEAIRHAGLVDCIVVTTRYFGGTLLGTGGLVRAYTAAANAALTAAEQVTVQVCVRGVLRVEYPLYELAQRLLADAGAHPEEVQFADRVTLPFVLLEGGETQLLPKLQELCRGSADITFSKPYFAPF